MDEADRGSAAATAAGQTPIVLPVHMRRNGFDPAPELGEIRSAAGVQEVTLAFGTTAYLVTRHADIKAVLSDPRRFSSRRAAEHRAGGDPEQAKLSAGSLLSTDPPDHQRLRHMLTPEFTARRMRALQPRIVDIVDEHLEAMEQAGPPADLMPAFALPIPSLVICELLGVPYADRADFQRRTTALVDLATPYEERLALQRESHRYMAGLVARSRRDPGADLLSMMVREHAHEITDDELIGIAGLLLPAGHETTANMLALGTLALLTHPDQLGVVRENPEATIGAVEELLRYLSIVHTVMLRMTTEDVEVAGVRIPAGRLVVLSLPAGNRDPAFIEDPDTFDIGRGALGHLAFGHGIHHCIGAPLARMELNIALPALLRRFPGLALAGRLSEVPFRTFHMVYGLESLEVTW